MATMVSDIFSSDDLTYLTQHKSVMTALQKSSIISTGMMSFITPITSSIRSSLETQLGMDLTNVAVLPMRWIKGDIASHVDIGTAPFQNSYVIYLQDCQGSLLLDSVSYTVAANTGFVVKQGTTHETQNMGLDARLIVGPMNERGEPLA